MEREGNRPRPGRPKNAENYETRDLNRRFKQLISDEMFDKIVLAMYDVAVNGARAIDRIKAGQYIIDRLAGRVPEQITVSAEKASTVADILHALHERGEAGGSSHEAWEASSETITDAEGNVIARSKSYE